MGIKNSLETIKAANVPIDEVLRILMTAQGFDAMRDMAASGKSTIVFAPNSPDGFAKLFTAMAGAEIAGKST